MAKWKRHKQEHHGSYYFTGNMYVTRGVAQELTHEEITAIYVDVKTYIYEHKGADYLFIYTDEQGRKLYLIDSLNRDMIQSGQYGPDDNYCTLMFAHEY